MLLLLVLRLAVSAVLPTFIVAVLAPATALALVAAVFRAGVALGPLALDERGEDRPLLRRHGFWVVALGILTSLFSSVIISRAVVNLIYGRRRKLESLSIGQVWKPGLATKL